LHPAPTAAQWLVGPRGGTYDSITRLAANRAQIFLFAITTGALTWEAVFAAPGATGSPRRTPTDGTRSGELFTDILPWLIVLIVVVIIGGVAIYVIRRSLTIDGGRGGQGFTLHDLREMHLTGEISDEEFERAKMQMIGRLKDPLTSEKPLDGGEENGAAGNPPAA
jgi:uncharacterized membrane protein